MDRLIVYLLTAELNFHMLGKPIIFWLQCDTRYVELYGSLLTIRRFSSVAHAGTFISFQKYTFDCTSELKIQCSKVKFSICLEKKLRSYV